MNFEGFSFCLSCLFLCAGSFFVFSFYPGFLGWHHLYMNLCVSIRPSNNFSFVRFFVHPPCSCVLFVTPCLCVLFVPPVCAFCSSPLLCVLGHWDNGTLGHWDTATMWHQDNGKLLQWDTGDTGPAGLWDTGTPEQWLCCDFFFFESFSSLLCLPVFKNFETLQLSLQL